VVRILAVAGDAGGASALLPVVDRLRSDGAQVDCRAYRAAHGMWERAGLGPEPVAEYSLHGIDRVLLGTTVGPEQWELRIIQAARGRAIRTVSVLDFWEHYRERFTLPDGALVVPDVVGVMDERSLAQMIEAGFPPDAVVVTGHPALDDLARYDDPVLRARARHGLAALAEGDTADRYVTYVSQPLSELFTRDALGFTEGEVLEAVVDALTEVLERRSASVHLILKSHPRETRFTAPRAHGSRLRVRVMAQHEMDVRHLVTASDLVVGMNSILLMEACLLHVPVVSYQPDLRISDPLPSNALGWSRAVTARVDLAEALDGELFDPAVRMERRRRLATVVRPGGATGRVTSLLMAERGTACHA
jgi:hypothetical protein